MSQRAEPSPEPERLAASTTVGPLMARADREYGSGLDEAAAFRRLSERVERRGEARRARSRWQLPAIGVALSLGVSLGVVVAWRALETAPAALAMGPEVAAPRPLAAPGPEVVSGTPAHETAVDPAPVVAEPAPLAPAPEPPAPEPPAPQPTAERTPPKAKEQPKAETERPRPHAETPAQPARGARVLDVELSRVELLARLGRSREALQESEALLRATTSPAHQAQLHMLRGNVYRQSLSDWSAAAAEFARAEPFGGALGLEACRQRAASLEALGDLPGALAAYRRYTSQPRAPRRAEALRRIEAIEGLGPIGVSKLP